MQYSLFLLLLLLLLASGQTEDDGSFQVSQPVWVVIGVLVFGVVVVISFTWIMFTYSICKVRRKYRKFAESLRRNRQTRERVQASSNHPVGGRDAPPLAITYRTNQRVPAQVYVSLAQLTAMAQGLQARRQDAPHRLPELNEELDEIPSAPPHPDSPPDYYELIREQEREDFLSRSRTHQHHHGEQEDELVQE